jgi:hypothetical protein
MVVAVRLPSEFDEPPTMTVAPTVSFETETVVGSVTGVELE